MFEVVDGVDRVDFDRVHAWLASTYWSPGVARERVERAARNSSLVVSAFVTDEVGGKQQAGYLRVVSDKTTFGWICDVFVGEEFRGGGIALGMVRHALNHPEHVSLRRWILATKDAHAVYKRAGFEPLPNPDRWMIYLANPGPFDRMP